MRSKRAQSIIEYALLVAIVTAAFLAMRLYVQRGVNAGLKEIENQLNEDMNPDE